MARPRRPEPPPLPRIVLERVEVATPQVMTVHSAPSRNFDVVAKTPRGREIKRWPWWAADKPRSKRARFMVLNGVRYQVELTGAFT